MANDTGFVCTWKSGMSRKHAELLSGLDKRTFICYDSDPAGKSGADAAIELLRPLIQGVRKIELPEGKDPGDLVAAEWQTCLSRNGFSF
mgnify:FL=1